MWSTVVISLLGIISLLWIWMRKKCSLFSKHGVPEAKSWFPFGSAPTWKLITGTPFTILYNSLYEEFKHEKMVGFYGPLGKPQLLVIDLDLAKTVLVKDFEFFQNRQAFGGFQDEYLDEMLTQLEGDRWKQARSLVSPVFTSGKLKLMLPLIDQVSKH
jgi:cytochrome P450 family 6